MSDRADVVWEEQIYSRGLHLNRYPWDAVVSFVYRHLPDARSRETVRLLEVGCGAGNNVWFAAREGLDVAGIDASPSAVAYARQRMEADGLRADLRVGSFDELPWADASFDLVVDRASLQHVPRTVARQTVREVRRVLVPGGKFFFNPIASDHSSRSSGTDLGDGLVGDISEGTLANVGLVCFYAREDVEDLLSAGWEILELVHEVLTDAHTCDVHSSWRAIASRV